jgi:hypothetical protein
MASLIFTNNAMRGIQKFDLTKDIIYGVVQNYDRKGPGRDPGTTIYHRETGAAGFVTVVGKNKGNEVLIISCWARRPQGGYARAKDDPRAKNAGFWKRVWLDILHTFGM